MDCFTIVSIWNGLRVLTMEDVGGGDDALHKLGKMRRCKFGDRACSFLGTPDEKEVRKG